jgi:hypothetical protein
MPFDGAGFPERDDPPRRRGRAPSDNVVTAIVVAVAVCLLVTPISMAALVDIVRYFRGS